MIVLLLSEPTIYIYLSLNLRLIGKPKLLKLKRKNKWNSKLVKAIDQLILDIELGNWKNEAEVKIKRPDADCVHNDGFYFFNINIHRTLIRIELDEDGEVTVVWAGTHQEYETIFKNNKDVIKKWLKSFS